MKRTFPPFGPLATLTEDELARLIDYFRSVMIDGHGIGAALPVLDRNAILLSPAAQVEVLGAFDGGQVIVTRDAFGVPTADPLWYVTPEGDVLCTFGTSVTSPTQARVVPRFQLLLDVSGSMAPVEADLQAAASRFVADMPETAWCRVSLYNGAYRALDTGNGTRGWKPCQAESWSWGAITAEGGTESTGALLSAFIDIAAPHPMPLAPGSHVLTGLVVISDGDGVQPGEIETLRQRKGDTPVLVHFMGESSTASYRSWVNQMTQGSDGAAVRQSVKAFADTFLAARVIDTKACASGLSVAP